MVTAQPASVVVTLRYNGRNSGARAGDSGPRLASGLDRLRKLDGLCKARRPAGQRASGQWRFAGTAGDGGRREGRRRRMHDHVAVPAAELLVYSIFRLSGVSTVMTALSNRRSEGTRKGDFTKNS